MTDALPGLVDRVARYAADRLDVETRSPFEVGMALSGLLAVDRHPEAVRTATDRAVDTQTDEGLLGYGWGDYPREWARWVEDDMSGYKPTINSTIYAPAVLAAYERSGEERYLDALRRVYAFYEVADRTADGGIIRRLDERELFTETVYFLSPLFIRYGELADHASAREEALTQLDVHVRHLRDPYTGLFRHIWRERPDSYPLSQLWSRANGWMVAGLVDTAAALPADHAARDRIAEALVPACEALLPLQDGSGFWHLVLDDPTSALETSGTAIFAYTFRRGLEEGLLEGDRYDAAARRAMDACEGVVDDEGAVRRVTKPPASATSPMGVTLYGQGWFLLAASRFV